MALIVNMKMPKSCTGCCLMGSPNCPYKGDSYVRRKEHTDCAIIGEIPDKHGRLVDADKMFSVLERACCTDSLADTIARDILEGLIKNAPTVIEASEERE